MSGKNEDGVTVQRVAGKFWTVLVDGLVRLLALGIVGAIGKAVGFAYNLPHIDIPPLLNRTIVDSGLFRQLVGFVAWQMVVAAVIAFVFGVAAEVWLWVVPRGPFIPNYSDAITRRAHSIFWMCAVLVGFSYIFPLVGGYVGPLRTAVLDGSSEGLMFAVLLLLGFVVCVVLGVVVFASILYAVSPAQFRVIAAPPLLRPVFRAAAVGA